MPQTARPHAAPGCPQQICYRPRPESAEKTPGDINLGMTAGDDPKRKKCCCRSQCPRIAHNADRYGWFAEGFGAPDVNDANALFEELDATPIASAIRSGCGTKRNCLGRTRHFRSCGQTGRTMSSWRYVLCVGGNPPRLDRIQKTTPVTLRLVGVSHREFCDRFVELAVIAHIARQCHRIARPRMSACQGTAAERAA